MCDEGRVVARDRARLVLVRAQVDVTAAVARELLPRQCAVQLHLFSLSLSLCISLCRSVSLAVSLLFSLMHYFSIAIKSGAPS